jgi:IS30 family transposase
MGRRGRKRDLNREMQYWESLASGVGTTEARRLVGVSRKTGYRWRAEIGGVIARKRSEGSGRYLSMFDRQRIASLHELGHGVRDIARKASRSASTISRELTRSAKPWDDGYDPVMAHLRAHERARRPRRARSSSPPGWHRSSRTSSTGDGAPSRFTFICAAITPVTLKGTSR